MRTGRELGFGVGIGVVVVGGEEDGGVTFPCLDKAAFEKLNTKSNSPSCFNVFMMNCLFVMAVMLIDGPTCESFTLRSFGTNTSSLQDHVVANLLLMSVEAE